MIVDIFGIFANGITWIPIHEPILSGSFCIIFSTTIHFGSFFWHQGEWFPVFKGRMDSIRWLWHLYEALTMPPSYYSRQMTMRHNFSGGVISSNHSFTRQSSVCHLSLTPPTMYLNIQTNSQYISELLGNNFTWRTSANYDHHNVGENRSNVWSLLWKSNVVSDLLQLGILLVCYLSNTQWSDIYKNCNTTGMYILTHHQHRAYWS